jgi:hypothetical protein
MSKPLQHYRTPNDRNWRGESRQHAWDRITSDTWTAQAPGWFRSDRGVILRKVSKEEYKTASGGNCTTQGAHWLMAFDSTTGARLRDPERGYPIGGADLHSAIEDVTRYQRKLAKAAEATQPRAMTAEENTLARMALGID